MSGKRTARVADQILKEIAYLLVQKVKDPRVRGVTLTGSHLSDDLKHARIYFSVLGDQSDVLMVQSGLDSAKGFIKKRIGVRLKLRYTPDIVFEHDPTLKLSNDLEKLFRKIRSEETKVQDE